MKLGRPLSLRLTLGPLRHGRADPCMRIARSTCLRASRTPLGPVTMMIEHAGTELSCRAWGLGAEWAIENLEMLVGEHQSDGDFATDNSVVRQLHRRQAGLRVPRGGAVFEALLPAIIEQRVTGMEAKRSYVAIVRHFGQAAPGPFSESGLRLAPSAETMTRTPSWMFHRYGVERKRADAIRSAARVAHRLEEATTMDPTTARQRLTAVSGVGPWTAAEVAFGALGDPDAVSVGDYHHPNHVAWALAGEPRADDRRMLELLEPYRGQRGRVLRLIVTGHPQAPKYGPRYSPHQARSGASPSS